MPITGSLLVINRFLLQGPAHTPPSEPVMPNGPFSQQVSPSRRKMSFQSAFKSINLLIVYLVCVYNHAQASWGQGNSAAMPPHPRNMPLATHPSLYPTNTHARVSVSPSGPPAPLIPPVGPQYGTLMQNSSPAIVNPPRLPVVAHEPPNNGGGQGPRPWSAINLQPKPST